MSPRRYTRLKCPQPGLHDGAGRDFAKQLEVYHDRRAKGVIGLCNLCGIHVHQNERPHPAAMPCNLVDCPFETPSKQNRHLTEDELARLARILA